MTRPFVRLALATLLLSMAQLPATAQGFDMGPLNPFLKEEADAVWTLRNQGGAVLMENRSTPGHLNYYQATTSPGSEGQRVITLDVALLASNAESLAGLLYGFQSQPKTYYMFTVGGDRSVNLHQMIDGRLESRMKWRIADLKSERTVLAIREKGNTISLSVNGVEKSTFGNDRIGRGAVGIVAGGVGAFRFSQFRVSSPDQARAKPVQAADARPAARADARADLQATQPAVAAAPPLARDWKPGKVVWHPVKDQNTGALQWHWPLPAGWTLAPPNPEGVVFKGPDGITVSFSPQMKFITTSDPLIIQVAQRSGDRRIAPWLPMERVLHEIWKPQLAQKGYTFVDARPEPQAADFWRRKDHGQRDLGMLYEAIGSHWKRPDGSPAYVLLSRVALPGNPFTGWDVLAMEVRAPAPAFESARAAWVYALFNTRFDEGWQRSQAIATQRLTEEGERRNAAAMAHLMAGHRARMAAIESAGQARASTAKTYSDILDISHAGYLKRSDIASQSQARTVRAIQGSTVISNTNTQESYQVPSGSKHYWVNTRGEYIGTDNSLLDPRTDPRLNATDWTRFNEQR